MSDVSNPYQPIAVGFFLLALPLLVTIWIAEGAAGRWTNGVAAGVMLLCGALLWRGGRR